MINLVKLSMELADLSMRRERNFVSKLLSDLRAAIENFDRVDFRKFDGMQTWYKLMLQSLPMKSQNQIPLFEYSTPTPTTAITEHVLNLIQKVTTHAYNSVIKQGAFHDSAIY